jgi:hypothetical protein
MAPAALDSTLAVALEHAAKMATVAIAENTLTNFINAPYSIAATSSLISPL